MQECRKSAQTRCEPYKYTFLISNQRSGKGSHVHHRSQNASGKRKTENERERVGGPATSMSLGDHHGDDENRETDEKREKSP